MIADPSNFEQGLEQSAYAVTAFDTAASKSFESVATHARALDSTAPHLQGVTANLTVSAAARALPAVAPAPVSAGGLPGATASAGMALSAEQQEAVAAKAERLTASIEKQAAFLERQAATFGLTAREAALYRLQLEGATEADVAGAQAALTHLAAIEAQQKAMVAQKAIKDDSSKLADSFKEQIDARKEQAATVGMSARQADIYKLKTRGASAADLEQATAADKALTAMEGKDKGLEKQAKDQAYLAGLPQRIGGKVLDKTMGFMEKQSAAIGGGTAPKDPIAGALGQVGSFASLLPKPLGDIVSTITDTIGTILTFFNAESNQMKKRVKDAFSEVIGGSMNARQAIADVKINTLTEGFQRLFQERMGEMMGGQSWAQAFQGAGAQEQIMSLNIDTIVQRAERGAQLAAQIAANPRLQQMNQIAAGTRAVEGARSATVQTQTEGAGARMRTDLLAQGQSLEAANEAMQRFTMQQTLANQIQVTAPPGSEGLPLAMQQQFEQLARADAMRRAGETLAPQLAQMAARQVETRGAQAGARVGESLVAGREDMEMGARRIAQLRDMRPIVADVTQEEQALAVLRRAGASEVIIRQREGQIGQIRAQREQVIATEQGRAVIEQTRNPLETFERQQEHLQDLYHRGRLGAEGSPEARDTLARGMAQAADQLERANGQTPVGQQAMVEGSAAAASAIAAAQRQMQREDRGAALAAAIRGQRQVNEQTRDAMRRLLAVIESGQVFQVANP